MGTQLPSAFGNVSRKRNLIAAFALGAAIGIVAFFPVWIRNNGQLMDYGDYFVQYVPFIRELKRMIASGNLSWSWNSFLGDSFIGAYSYYTVFNPFAWILTLLPDEYILYGTMAATLLKLGISMVSSMLYLRLFCKRDILAMIGALLYTFSGFTLVNTNFYFFLDVIAVFPFLLYGLEKLMFERRRWIYILSLALNAAINYYFFVSTVILVVIYVLFRLELYKPSGWKANYKILLRTVIFSILGTGLAGIALVPSFFAVMGSGKATGAIGTNFSLIYYSQQILEHLKALLAPIESNRFRAFFDASSWSSTAVYLPVFGCFCALQWCIQKNGWLKKYLICMIIFFFIPALNAVFNLFSSEHYTRWLYGMALMLSLATVSLLEEFLENRAKVSGPVLSGISIFTGLLMGVPAVLYVLYYFGISLINRFASAVILSNFMGYGAIAVILVLTLLNYGALWCLLRRQKINIHHVAVCVIIFCAVNYLVYNELNYDPVDADYSVEELYTITMEEGEISEETEFVYRVDYPIALENYGLFKNLSGVNYYNSIQNAWNSRFAAAVGMASDTGDTVITASEESREYTDALLSVKYFYNYDDGDEVPEGFEYLCTENGVDIYENTNYISMGFVYSSYCTEEELEELSASERVQVMLNMLVVQSEDESIAEEYLLHSEDLTDLEDLSIAAEERNETTCSYFSGTSSGFTAEIVLEEDNIVFFSIPNDSGWEIQVNGDAAEIIEVNYGLIGIVCASGTNVITATYHVRGLSLGLICSVGSAAAVLIILISLRIHGKSRRGRREVKK